MESQYSATVFLPNDEGTPVEQVNAKLMECLKARNPNRVGVNEWPGSYVTSGDVLTAYWDEWPLHLYFSTEPDVAEENQDWAESNTFKPPFDVIAKCTKRVELWTGEDPNMDYFNNYIFILEEIEKRFEGAIIIDDAAGLV